MDMAQTISTPESRRHAKILICTVSALSYRLSTFAPANVPEETTTFVNGTSETAPPTDVTNTTTAPVQVKSKFIAQQL